LTGLNNITHAWGSLTIEHNDALTSLAGLEGLTRIEITLTIGFNTALSSLDGLENLASTSGGIFVYYNDVLTSLSGLQGLTSIAGDLYFDTNPMLTSLNGLENISSNSIVNLSIFGNSSLSTCEIENICDYLANPNGTVSIYNNATGCNSQEEVEEACGVGLMESNISGYCSIFPNPSDDQFAFTFTMNKPAQVRLVVMDRLGRIVATIMDESLSQGNHQVTWHAKGIPSGIYGYLLTTGNQSITGKMVVMR
jgi:hypothetical protein